MIAFPSQVKRSAAFVTGSSIFVDGGWTAR